MKGIALIGCLIEGLAAFPQIYPYESNHVIYLKPTLDDYLPALWGGLIGGFAIGMTSSFIIGWWVRKNRSIKV
jgi:hypothetical protein